MTARPDRDPLPTSVSDLPLLPPAFFAALENGLRPLGVDAPSPDRLTAMADHVRLLVAWNEAINLSGIRDPVAMAVEHVADSLSALPVLRRAGVGEFVDIGSGAGFPGLCLAIALSHSRALLLDSVAKKARFLATAVEALGLAGRVRVTSDRAETLARDPAQRGRWQAVVARAVASLPELSELALPLLREGGLLVAWKRRPLAAELAEAERWLGRMGGRLAGCEQQEIPGLEDHVLVLVEKVAATPPRYPREPAARRRPAS